MGIWVNNLTKAPYLLLFVLLISVGVGTASALVTITLAGNTIVQGTLTADEYFDNGNTQSGVDATALGGIGNTASGDRSTVGGGTTNIAGGTDSNIGGGNNNLILNSGTQATIGGGLDNIATSLHSTIGGGEGNRAQGGRSTIAGGLDNNALAPKSTVGGGFNNFAGGGDGRGFFSTVPGGRENLAGGDYSFAAGRQAKATHDGAFVWADSTNAVFASTADNEFSIRAAGGVRVVGDITCTNCFEVTFEVLNIVVPASGTIAAVLDCPNPTASVTGFYIDDLNFNSPADIRAGSGITPDGNTLTLMLVTDGTSGDTINIHFICLSI